MSKRSAELQEFLNSHYCRETASCSDKLNPHVQSGSDSDSDSDSDANCEIHSVDTELHEEVARARASCPHCSDLLSKLQTRIRRCEGTVDDISDFGLKRRSYHIDIRNDSFQCTCSHGDCKRKVRWGSIIDAREKLWGKPKARPPNRKERNERIEDLLVDAHSQYIATLAVTGKACSPLQQFVFMLGNEVVCEKAFFYMLFVPKSNKKMTRLKKQVLSRYGIKFDPLPHDDRNDDISSQKDCPKFIHACAHIQNAALLCSGGFSAFEGHDNTIYIPYPDIHYLFYEYEAFCTRAKINRASRAGLSTFRLAWQKMSVDLCLSLSGGRGGHDTCAVCANAKELLRECDKSGWSPQERDIIMEFRRQHIYQQMQERIHLEANIAETYYVDPLGRPISALILIDAMSKDRGNTPFNGLANKKSDTDVITSRLFGAEVHCGHVHGTFFYYTDDLVSGGGNIVAQIMREALLDLSILLKKRKDVDGNDLCLPRQKLIYQFDNCAENKNYTVFTLVSLMVQKGFFKAVHINFLIVGHTHCSIDQYFSVVARALHRCSYIASPLALETVWSTAFTGDDKGRLNPLVVRKIDAVYDLKAEFAQFRAPPISCISFPFCFKFTLYFGIVTLQYKQYSTHRDWLPQRPENVDLTTIKNVPVRSKILVSNFDFAGGRGSFFKSIGVNRVNLDMTLNDSATVAIQQLTALSTLADRLTRMEALSLLTMRHRFEKAGDGIPSESLISSTIRELLVKSNSKCRGVLIPIRHDQSFDNLNPKLLNYVDSHSYLDDMPDLTETLGMARYASAIMRQMRGVWKPTGISMNLVVDSTPPPGGDVDVFAFMRRVLLFVKNQKKEQARLRKDQRGNNISSDDSPDSSINDYNIGITGAAEIAKTARSVFDQLMSGKLHWHNSREIVTRSPINQLANQEVVFYFERLFEPIVVATLRRTLKRKMGPFELVPSQCFNVVDIDRDNQRMKEAMTLRFDHVRMVLSESKKRFPEGVEFLGRRAKDQRTEDVVVDSYKECAILGCSNMCMFNSACAECGISTCSQREHSEHASHIGLPLKDPSVPDALPASSAEEPPNKKKRHMRTRRPVAVAAPSPVASSKEDPHALREELDDLKAKMQQFMNDMVTRK